MHQSHPRHSSPLMNADTLNGDCVSVLEYRSIALSVVGRKRLPCNNSGPPIGCYFPSHPCFNPIWSAVWSVFFNLFIAVTGKLVFLLEKVK